jgi:hypothetical protein
MRLLQLNKWAGPSLPLFLWELWWRMHPLRDVRAFLEVII